MLETHFIVRSKRVVLCWGFSYILDLKICTIPILNEMTCSSPALFEKKVIATSHIQKLKPVNTIKRNDSKESHILKTLISSS